MWMEVELPCKGVDVHAVSCPGKGSNQWWGNGDSESSLTDEVKISSLQVLGSQIWTMRQLPTKSILHWEPQTQAF